MNIRDAIYEELSKFMSPCDEFLTAMNFCERRVRTHLRDVARIDPEWAARRASQAYFEARRHGEIR